MSTLASVHANLRHFSDVTIVSGDGKPTTIHPLILSAMSAFVRDLLLDLPSSESHPVILLPDFSSHEVSNFLEALLGRETCENRLINVLFINLNIAKEEGQENKKNVVNIKGDDNNLDKLDMKEENLCITPKKN